ncbi:hypothetical protein D3C86_984850 [compost metagenome]
MEIVENDIERLIEMRVRITLRQKPEKSTHGLYAINRGRRLHQLCGAQLQRLDAELAEMIVKARAPDDIHPVSGL